MKKKTSIGIIQNQPLFSVLVANFNNGQYLEDCLQSIFAQTYQNWEIIIVDDASTDNSSEIYQRYATDQRIKIYYNPKNKGCGYTKRKCVEYATGEICGFVDPDDAITPDAIEAMMMAHYENPKCSIISSKFYYTDLNLIVTEEGIMGEAIPEGQSYLTYGNYAITHFATFKSKHYNLTEGINQNLKQAVDQDLYYKLEEIGTPAFLDKFLYLYRITSSSISANVNSIKAIKSHLQVVKYTYVRRLSQQTKARNFTKREYENTKFIFHQNIMRLETKRRNVLNKYANLFMCIYLFPFRDIKYNIKCIVLPCFA